MTHCVSNAGLAELLKFGSESKCGLVLPVMVDLLVEVPPIQQQIPAWVAILVCPLGGSTGCGARRVQPF